MPLAPRVGHFEAAVVALPGKAHRGQPLETRPILQAGRAPGRAAQDQPVQGTPTAGLKVWLVEHASSWQSVPVVVQAVRSAWAEQPTWRVARVANGGKLRHRRPAMGALANLAFPALRLLDPERAHALALFALRNGLVGGRGGPLSDPRLRVTWLGHALASPIGLAAGFDKNATCVAALARLGFGALEVGTVTPLPQPGNARPRMFRLAESAAVINRMGFNSDGLERVAARLRQVERRVPVGVNIGPNKDSALSPADPPGDIARMVGALAGHVDWVTINVSSPNTPGLRGWQTPERLAALLRAVSVQVPEHPPVLIKLAPDLPPASLPDIIEACVQGGAAGLIVSNTTITRPQGLRGRHAAEAGGLSGRPLMGPSTAMLKHCARLAAGRLVLVGTGGIACGADVVAKLRAGAGLVQLYTALALQGPALLPRLCRDVLAELGRQGFPDVRSAIGADL